MKPVERSVLRDTAWIVGTFVVLGVVAGLVWWQVVSPPTFQRTEAGAVMDQRELAHRIRADGWFSVIGLVCAVGAGFALMGRLGRARPLLVVVIGALASLGAAWLALKIGTTLGHHDVRAELKSAAVGTRAPDSLTLVSKVALVIWPIGYLAAALAVLLGTDPEEPLHPSAGNQPGSAPVNEGVETQTAG